MAVPTGALGHVLEKEDWSHSNNKSLAGPGVRDLILSPGVPALLQILVIWGCLTFPSVKGVV